ncbi:unannotated protein [freshwater metagenome]|uniref:Unannotated protein n=1 Tax=freshwater metagenome TaxID=449393 RepID=A0A6J7DT54_9ZZZZ
MNRDIARKNIKIGLSLGAVCFVMFGLSFVAAILYNAS